MAVDESTVAYYDANAHQIASRYEAIASTVARYFALAFRPGQRVLDVGAGSGRDMAALIANGCEAYGVDPSDLMLSQAASWHPELQGRLKQASLPDLGLPFGGQFDGVLCSAVLMHVPQRSIFEAAFAVREVLKDGGTLLISIPLTRPGLVEERDLHGRLFTQLQPDYLQLLFERLGFILSGKWVDEDSQNRAGHSWCTMLYQLAHKQGIRPADQIEGILVRDRKTTTYKLALLRALAEIATAEYEQARWLSKGRVGIPIDIVCEKWLLYYWPLFESGEFVAQIRGETPGCCMPVAFRSALNQLISEYRKGGGLKQVQY